MDNIVRIRWWINDHAVTVTVLSVILLVICFGAMLQQYRPPTHLPQITSEWFFDQVTGTIFEAHSNAIPPIATTEYPDQLELVEAGVRAYIFACGECPTDLQGMTIEQVEQSGAFVGWLEQYTDAAKEEMSRAHSLRADKHVPPVAFEFLMLWEKGHQICRTDDEQWVLAMSEDGVKIMHDLRNRCAGGNYPKRCYPNTRHKASDL